MAANNIGTNASSRFAHLSAQCRRTADPADTRQKTKGGRMYKTIMVPVDLEHADRIGKALRTASDLARHYDAEVCYVGVAAATPGRVAHGPEEFARKLDAFGRAEGEKGGHRARSKAVISHDPAADVDHKLADAVRETGADLVVMASHVPGVADAIWPSHGGRLASHAEVSVFVVR
jgi:nucleotide-binding universal stress UspA family protein